MNLYIQLDTILYTQNITYNLYEWLDNLTNLILQSNKIEFFSDKPLISGPILDSFFTKIKSLPNCMELLCNNNFITKLPLLPSCEGIDCSDNKIIKLPDLPKCKSLLCFNNDIEILPKLNNCINLSCTNNNLKQ